MNEPKHPQSRRPDAASQGIVRDERGQDQPADKQRSQKTSPVNAPPNDERPPFPGQPAKGE